MKIKSVQIITVILLVLSIVLMIQISNIYPDTSIIQGKIKNQEQTVIDSKDILGRIEKLIIFTAENKTTIRKFDSILPADDDKANLLSSLDSLARSNNLGTIKISFKEESEANPQQPGAEGVATTANDFDTRIIKMSIRGSYVSFKNFLAVIENNVRVMDVKSFDFTPSSSLKEEEQGPKVYSYNIELKTYQYKSSKADNVSRLLSSGKFKSFAIENLNFANEKVFKSLELPSSYNIDTGVDEIGNRDIF